MIKTWLAGSSNQVLNLLLFKIICRLQGNPICVNANLVQFCGSQKENDSNNQSSTNSNIECQVQSCPYEYVPASPVPCFCAAPLFVNYRLKSPGFSDFLPYRDRFHVGLASNLKLNVYQLDIYYFEWEVGPRLRMDLKIFPIFDNNSHFFNGTEVLRIRSKFTEWKITDSAVFGPYEILNFTLWGPYINGLSHGPYTTCFALETC